MRRILRTVGAIAVAAGAVMATGAAPASAATYYGCPAGYACLYPQNAGWNAGQPSAFYYLYRSYNLSNQYGTHRFLNNQTGGAAAYLCTGYNGGGTCSRVRATQYLDTNFTPINSIKLLPY